MKNPLFLFHLFLMFNVHPILAQHTCVFIGSFNWDKDTEGIYVYELDTVKGSLKKITSYTGISNPSFLTVSPDGRFVYSCTESKTPNAGSVSSFEFRYPEKSLTFLNKQPTYGENPVYLSVYENGKWLIEGNYTQSSASVYPLTKEGRIDTVAQHIGFSGGSIVKSRQEKSHIHSTVFSPDFKYVFIPDLGADTIRCYKFDPSLKAPLQAFENGSINTVPGSGPRHFTFHPNKKFAYCIEELSGTIDAYHYKNGTLIHFQRIETHPKEITDGFESSDIHISPDGKFLYVSNRGKEDNIAIFSVAKNGTLENEGYQPVSGEHPRIFALDASGKFVIVANVRTSNVVVFKRDTTTGLLKKTGEEHIKNPSCIQMYVY